MGRRDDSRKHFFFFFFLVAYLLTVLGLCCCPSSLGAAVSRGPSPAVVRGLLSCRPWAPVSEACGFSIVTSRLLEHRLSRCGAQASLL